MSALAAAKATGRRFVRARALDVLSTAGQVRGAQARDLATPRVHFLYLHAVPPAEEFAFRKMLERLATTHEFVSHTEGVRRLRTGEVTRPAVSFSFDDGFASNFRTGSILEEFGTVGMFYIPVRFPGTATVADAQRFFRTSVDVDEPAMTWRQIDSLAERGHEIGNHTATHRNLAQLGSAEAIDDIHEGYQTIAERYGACPHFAWPFGRRFHITPEVATAALEIGHDTVASAERGSHSAFTGRESAPLLLLRDHLMTSWPARHIDHFVARGARTPIAPYTCYPQEWLR